MGAKLRHRHNNRPYLLCCQDSCFYIQISQSDPETTSPIAGTPDLSQPCPLVMLDRAPLGAPFEAGNVRRAVLLLDFLPNSKRGVDVFGRDFSSNCWSPWGKGLSTAEIACALCKCEGVLFTT